MASAISLLEAANQASENLFAKYITNTIKANLLSFAQQVLVVFPQADSNGHPGSNWATLIAALSATLPTPPLTLSLVQLQNAVQYVYRICLVVKYLSDSNLIETAQADAVLTAYNAAF